MRQASFVDGWRQWPPWDGLASQRRLVPTERFSIDIYQQYRANLRMRGTERHHRGASGQIRREAKCAGRDGREGHGAGPKFISDLKATPVARGEHLGFAPVSAPPDRPHGVDDVTCCEPKSGCGLRVPRFAAAQSRARRGQLGLAGRLVDSAIDTASAHQAAVCGIHNGVDIQCGDIS
jgi:hypothetical protein